MAITEIPGGMWMGTMPGFSSAVPGVSTMFALDTSTEKQGVVFRVPKTGTLDKFEFMMSTVGNNPDNGLRLSFQGVDAATGFPDGVTDQYRDIASGSISSNTWMAPGLMTDNGTDGGNKRSVTQGEWIACVIEFVSFVASDSVTLASVTLTTGRDNLAYTVNYSAATWNKNSFSTLQLRFVLKYDDGTYVNISPDLLPIATFVSTAFGSTSTPDEYALRFQVPFECELSAVMLRATIGSSVPDFVLYDSGGSVVFTISMDPDFNLGGGNYVLVVPPTTLTANSTYRFAIKPTNANNYTIYSVTVNSNAHLGAFPGGIEFYQSTRTDAGAWTDTTTTRPWMYLYLSGIELGSAGGGGGSFVSIG